MSHVERSTSFGEDPEAYDRSRPGYPDEVVDLLVAGTTDALDVGCGTGKFGRLLLGRGCRVLGVEHDERMAAVARSHGLEVDVASFEAWDDRGRRFDLVASAQAWHWIDQDAGARRAADVLRPGGRLAVVWNLSQHDEATKAVLDGIYRRLAPELMTSVALGIGVSGEPLAGVDETGAFEPQQRTVVTWDQAYTTAEWLDQLPTHSDHRLLPAERREALLAAVGEALDARGGGLVQRYSTLVITARRT